MTTKTKTVQTEYGDVEIDVVECDSCGIDVRKDKAKDFNIGQREGYACEMCEQNGPVSFPESTVNGFDGIDWFIIANYPVGVLLGVVFVLREGSAALTNEGKGFITAILGTILWTCIVIGLTVVV